MCFFTIFRALDEEKNLTRSRRMMYDLEEGAVNRFMTYDEVI